MIYSKFNFLGRLMLILLITTLIVSFSYATDVYGLDCDNKNYCYDSQMYTPSNHVRWQFMDIFLLKEPDPFEDIFLDYFLYDWNLDNLGSPCYQSSSKLEWGDAEPTICENTGEQYASVQTAKSVGFNSGDAQEEGLGAVSCKRTNDPAFVNPTIVSDTTDEDGCEIKTWRWDGAFWDDCDYGNSDEYSCKCYRVRGDPDDCRTYPQWKPPNYQCSPVGTTVGGIVANPEQTLEWSEQQMQQMIDTYGTPDIIVKLDDSDTWTSGQQCPAGWRIKLNHNVIFDNWWIDNFATGICKVNGDITENSIYNGLEIDVYGSIEVVNNNLRCVLNKSSVNYPDLEDDAKIRYLEVKWYFNVDSICGDDICSGNEDGYNCPLDCPIPLVEGKVGFFPFEGNEGGEKSAKGKNTLMIAASTVAVASILGGAYMFSNSKTNPTQKIRNSLKRMSVSLDSMRKTGVFYEDALTSFKDGRKRIVKTWKQMKSMYKKTTKKKTTSISLSGIGPDSLLHLKYIPGISNAVRGYVNKDESLFNESIEELKKEARNDLPETLFKMIVDLRENQNLNLIYHNVPKILEPTAIPGTAAVLYSRYLLNTAMNVGASVLSSSNSIAIIPIPTVWGIDTNVFSMNPFVRNSFY